jgi:hypothetical protein
VKRTFILCIILLSSYSMAAVWKTGNFKVELTKLEQAEWSSANCVKECELTTLAKDFYKSQELTATEMQGGKNPGSVVCKKVGGKIIYLEFQDLVEAFCQKDQTIVSLGRLVD